MNSTTSSPPESPSPTFYPAAALLSTFAGLSVILCIPPLVLHIKSRNIAVALLIFWVALSNLFNFINPLIWPADILDDRWNGAGLCDIEVKLNIAWAAAVPGSLICIFRQLAIILNADQTTITPTKSRRRRRIAFEVFFCAVVPAYMMLAHPMVQPYRYYLYAISGCTAAFDDSWGIVLIFLPPLVLCLVAVGYCILVLIRLIKYKREFTSILQSSNSKLNQSRFMRLFILSTFLIIVLLPISIYAFARNLRYPIHGYHWSAVHQPGWSTTIVRVATQGVVSFDRWISVALGYAVFVFFGFGTEATKSYRRWMRKIAFRRHLPGADIKGGHSAQ